MNYLVVKNKTSAINPLHISCVNLLGDGGVAIVAGNSVITLDPGEESDAILEQHGLQKPPAAAEAEAEAATQPEPDAETEAEAPHRSRRR